MFFLLAYNGAVGNVVGVSIGLGKGVGVGVGVSVDLDRRVPPPAAVAAGERVVRGLVVRLTPMLTGMLAGAPATTAVTAADEEPDQCGDDEDEGDAAPGCYAGDGPW